MPVVVEVMGSTEDARLQEAGLHAFCKCLSEHKTSGPRMVAGGVIGAAVPLCTSSTPDIQARLSPQGALLLQ